MNESIIATLATFITGVLSVIAVFVSNSKANTEMDAKLDKAQAITDTKLDELTREVRQHNDFARRIPVLEEKISVVNHRLADLERGNK